MLYTMPEEFEAHRAVTAKLLEAVTGKFGGGDIVGVTGTNGNLTNLQRSRGRDDAFRDFPKPGWSISCPANGTARVR